MLLLLNKHYAGKKPAFLLLTFSKNYAIIFIENERKGDYLNMKKEPAKIKRVSISPADVKFVCDKERGYVRAYVYNTEDFFIDFCYANFPKLVYTFYDTKEFQKLKMNNRFEGLARLSPDDEWDENLGKLIAFNRFSLCVIFILCHSNDCNV